jgi:hypothetical protein
LVTKMSYDAAGNREWQQVGSDAAASTRRVNFT